VSVTTPKFTSLDGPGDDGIVAPDAEALLGAKKADLTDQDKLLEARKIEAKAAAAKAAETDVELTPGEEQKAIELIHVGRLERYVEVFGRTIQLRTLTIEEELKLSEITKHYLNTDGYARAYRTALVAAALRTIDGKLLFDPMSDVEFEQIIAKKFEILIGYYPLAVDQIYLKYRDMELELIEIANKLGKSSG